MTSFRYDAEHSPPSGQFLRLVSTYDDVVYWNGKRWWCPKTSDGSLQTQEAWPPDPADYGSEVEWRWVP